MKDGSFGAFKEWEGWSSSLTHQVSLVTLQKLETAANLYLPVVSANVCTVAGPFACT